MKIIDRERYLEQIRPYYGKQVVKVITGQRRVGKSYFLRQIENELRKKYPKTVYISIDLERFEFDAIRTHSDLYKYVKSKSRKGKNVLFIDEVQEVQEFERALKSLLAEGNFDIYVTGSNSRIVSGEIATFLSGRQVEIRLHSLSFPEFLLFNDLRPDEKSLERYLKHGGMPYLRNLPDDDELVYDYLKNIYATILYRDVVSRYQIRDIAFLENLTRFLADNTGNITSANSIADYLKSQKESKSVSVIISYINYLEQSYFISRARRQDVKGHRILSTGDKIYFQDLGLRNILTGYGPDDISKILENIVYNHLIAAGFKVSTGKLGDKEIDFIAEKGSEYSYYQVAYLLSDKKVVDREFGNLLDIGDNYPKYVISMDEFPVTASMKGVKHVRLIDFLLEG
jgi:predicted AAA+ superfamily ATPase